MRTAHALHEGDGFLVFAVDCRSSEKKKAACTTYFPYRTLNPNSRPVLSPRGRELERGQQAARLVLGRLELGCWERLPQFGECPLPPPPRGREQVTADSSVTGRLKKNARNINGRNFSGSLLSQGRWNKRRERFFRRPLNPSVGCVPQGTHAVGRVSGKMGNACVRTAHTLHSGYYGL